MCWEGWGCAGVRCPSLSLSAKAFHLKYEEVPLDANIRKWDVQVLSVSLGTGVGVGVGPWRPDVWFNSPALHRSVS